MEKNYTPLNIEALYPKVPGPVKEFDNVANTLLLILAVLTVLVISIVLFVIIQKSTKQQSLRPLFLPVASLPAAHG